MVTPLWGHPHHGPAPSTRSRSHPSAAGLLEASDSPAITGSYAGRRRAAARRHPPVGCYMCEKAQRLLATPCGPATGGTMSSIISVRHQRSGPTATPASVTGAMAVGARILGPSAMGPLALAVTAVGAIAVGRLAIANAVIRKLRAEEIEIGSLKVRELEVAGQRWTSSTISSITTAGQQP